MMYSLPYKHIEKQRYYFANKGPSSHGYGFSSGNVWMWELDYKECWALKNWCFWTAVLEKTLESPLDCKRSSQWHPKGNQSWIFTGRTDVEAETPILWPPDVKNWLIWKDPECWERMKVGGEGDNRGWDGWMASPTQWTWVWVNSGGWWWIGRAGVLQSTELQRVGHDWATELNWLINTKLCDHGAHLCCFHWISSILQTLTVCLVLSRCLKSMCQIYECKWHYTEKNV